MNDCIEPAVRAIDATERALSSKYGGDTIRWSVADDNESAQELDNLERELPIEVIVDSVERAQIRQRDRGTVKNSRPFRNMTTSSSTA